MNEFTITLTEQDLSIINAGLQELPMKFAAPLVVKINKQIEAAKAKPEQPDE